MKSKLIKALIIVVASIAVTACITLIFPADRLGDEITKQSVNMDKNLELHFEGYHIKLIEWDKEEILVAESRYHRDVYDEELYVDYDNNTLTVNDKNRAIDDFPENKGKTVFLSQSWLSLLQFDKYFEYSKQSWDITSADFFVYVPDGVKIVVYSNGIMSPFGEIDFSNDYNY